MIQLYSETTAWADETIEILAKLLQQLYSTLIPEQKYFQTLVTDGHKR